jgi:hypothetical protein
MIDHPFSKVYAGVQGEVWSLIVLTTETADLSTYPEISQTADYPHLMPV